VYAVDVEPERLARVANRFPYISTIGLPGDSMTPIPDASLDFVTAMMVMEHVPDEVEFLDEVRRVLKGGGRYYLTTVFKRRWAWYFRRRGGETVLDVSHLREYTDLGAFHSLLGVGRRFSRILDITLEPLWFPVVAPILFLMAGHFGARDLGGLAALRRVKVPVPGYYTLIVLLEA
jgi:SAM-dependent methyltransferase